MDDDIMAQQEARLKSLKGGKAPKKTLIPNREKAVFDSAKYYMEQDKKQNSNKDSKDDKDNN